MHQKEYYTFSASGRTEICGNHTDHQQGCVLAAAINLEITAKVRLNGTDEIRINSQGYPSFSVKLGDYGIRGSEVNSSAALVRGVAAAFARRGAVLKGFDAQITSAVLPGSGLSSSAAFEVLMGVILNELFMDNKLSAVEIAKIGQYAENQYFGKPSGLMDQIACAVRGLVYIDFHDPATPIVEKVCFDFSQCGYALCIIDSGADHADLTQEYAAIPREMGAVAAFFGKGHLRDVDMERFYRQLAEVRRATGDRAVLRAMHFFDECRRVQRMKCALNGNDVSTFLQCVDLSGNSSWQLLQNITPLGQTEQQSVAVCLALAKRLLNGRGAVRIHGGGFAGTVQAYVPVELLAAFKEEIEKAFGEGKCHVLSIRNEGAVMNA